MASDLIQTSPEYLSQWFSQKSTLFGSWLFFNGTEILSLKSMGDIGLYLIKEMRAMYAIVKCK